MDITTLTLANHLNATAFSDQTEPNIPTQFIWPAADRPSCATSSQLRAPLVDLSGFLNREAAPTKHAAEMIRAACGSHGFFHVTGHGVDPSLASDAMRMADEFFRMDKERKARARKKAGSIWGYCGAHSDRFTSRLPWKETLSLGYEEGGTAVADYFGDVMGKDFEEMGWVFENYCRAMKTLSLAIMELLAISLGIDRNWYKTFFDDGNGILRCNYYPPCQEPELALGTGPHCDPTALTILHQDDVAGLEVFADGKWQSIHPKRDALVINIGDTFAAMSNGKYRSCLHRAVVNRHRERKSMAFFLCPRGDKVIRSPPQLGISKYPEFRWNELLEFTQKQYRADTKTLQSFSQWIHSSSPD